MQALILAAGYGGRMRPLTHKRHKTLLKISGETIISRIVKSLGEIGILEIIVVLGYRAGELEDYLRNKHPNVSFHFIVNHRFAETNNIFSLALALDNFSITDDIILIESDLIFRPTILTRLLQSPYKNVALVDSYRTGMDGTVVKIGRNNRITEVIPPHLQSSDFNFKDKYKTLNVYKFDKDYINGVFKKIITYYAKTIDDNCYYELVLGLLIYMQQEGIHAEIVNEENWAEVDDPNDLSNAEFVFNVSDRINILENRFGGYWNYNVIDFCFIRNMYYPSDSMISEMKDSFEKLIHNYGSKQEYLNKKLSYSLLYDERNIQLLNGASQIYPILKNLYGNAKVLIPQPTFGEYTRIFSNVSTYDDSVGFEKSQIAIKFGFVDVCVIVNPNNPTGSILETEWIFQVIKENPDKLFIVDESFIDFSDQPSIISLVENYPLNNVLVISSLSKSWGVPGIRIGYCYTTNKKLMAKITAVIPIWNSNSLAEFFLEIFLKHREVYKESIIKTKEDRKIFSEMLQAIPVVDTVFPSGGNFLMVRLTCNASQACKLVEQALEQNIYMKNVSSRFDDTNGYLRLAVRKLDDHLKLIAVLKQLY